MRFPSWKYAVIVLVAILSVLYSLPNLYPDEPAIQVSGATASVPADKAVLARAEAALQTDGLAFHDSQVQDKGVLLRLDNTEAQIKAQDVIRRALGDGYVVALNLAPTTPDWLRAIGANPMKLGLDLRGGVHFLLEVDMDKALEQRLEGYVAELKKRLREQKIAYRSVADTKTGLIVQLEDAKAQEDALFLLRGEFQDFTATPATNGEFRIDLTFTEQKRRELADYAITQNLTTIRNRINELGVAEALVQRQGVNRIVVELPGVQDTAEAKRILGRTATLEFRWVDWEHESQSSTVAPPGTELFHFRGDQQPPVFLQKRKIVTGDRVTNAQMSFDSETSQPQVSIDLDSRGGRLMAEATRDNVGKRMAVLFVEQKQRTRFVMGPDGKEVEVREPYTEKQVINVATVQSMLGSSFRITGLDSPAEAGELALLLRAGGLAAPMYFVEERTVGPSLGQDNIDKGLLSIYLGFALVFAFMMVAYRGFGLIANVALLMNLALLAAWMGGLGAALSLPGIAGIVLATGMAVDANVLVNERIREELRAGMSPQAAIIAGYDRAFVTILDSNLTVLLVAAILWAIGSGPVKGFAVTLIIGTLASMFTATTVTRAIVQLVYGGRRRVVRLSI